MSERIWFRTTSAAVTLALAVTLGPSAAIANSGVSAPISPTAEVSERPDRESAMTTALAQDLRVEDLSARTPTSATYANKNGTWTTEAYAGVVRSKVDESTWVPVDSSLERRDGGYAPKATPFEVEFSDGGDQTLGSIRTSDMSTIEVGWPTNLPAPQVDGDRLTYQNAAQGSDLVVSSYPDGFNYSVVMHQAPAASTPVLEYRIPLNFDGATAVAGVDGSITVKNGIKRVATMTAPVMWDSSEPDESGQVARRVVTASVEGTGESRTLVLRPDMEFLRDPNTIFPVTVDPTVSLNAANDTWIDSLSQSSQYSSPELRVGSNNDGGTISRSFLYFNLSSLPQMPPSVLTAAEVRMSNFQTGTCAGTALRMSRITQGWSVPALTWGAQPTTTDAGSSTSTGSFGASGCPDEATVTFDSTAIVKHWSQNAGTNYGVLIKADNEAASSGFRKFRSLENGDTSKVPTLVMTFNTYPSTPTEVDVSPAYGGYTTSLTPTIAAVVSDPDGGPVGGYFEVRSGSTVVWSGSSPMATSGARVEVTVPAGVLSDNTSYTVAAYSQDEALKSLGPATRNIALDATGPPAAKITWSPFTNGAWLTTMPSTSTLTVDGSADTSGFNTILDGVAYSVAANSSGDYTTTWAPTAGWHTLEVVPVDKAGNLGAQSTFSFGTGSTGIANIQVNPGGPGYSTSTAPTFSAQVNDPNGGTPTATFEVRDDKGVVWAGTSSPVPSGGVATATVPEEILVIGMKYWVRARLDDSRVPPAWSQSVEFQVDAEAPSVPAPPCESECTTIASHPLFSGTIGAGDSQPILVTVPDPYSVDAVGRVRVKIEVLGAGAPGSLFVYNADYPMPVAPVMSYPIVAATDSRPQQTAELTPSIADAIMATNAGPSPVDVRITAIGWRTWIDDAAEPEEAPPPPDAEEVTAGSLPEEPVNPIAAGSACTVLDDGPDETTEICFEETPDPAQGEIHMSSTMDGEGEEPMLVTNSAYCPKRYWDRGWTPQGRYDACRTTAIKAVKTIRRNGVTTIVGIVYFYAHEVITLNRADLNVYHWMKLQWIRGDRLSELTLAHQAICHQVSPSCNTDINHTVTRISTVDQVSDSKVNRLWSNPADRSRERFNFVIMLEPWGTSATGTTGSYPLYSPVIRCDRVRYVAYSGCVFPAYIPTWTLYLSGRVPESAEHIQHAQGHKGMPRTLKRHYWFGARNLNRREARRECARLYPNTSGDCDEYPMASTYQGCHDSGGRWCHVKKIDPSDNQLAGSLLSGFFGRGRVLHEDWFHVRVGP